MSTLDDHDRILATSEKNKLLSASTKAQAMSKQCGWFQWMRCLHHYAHLIHTHATYSLTRTHTPGARGGGVGWMISPPSWAKKFIQEHGNKVLMCMAGLSLFLVHVYTRRATRMLDPIDSIRYPNQVILPLPPRHYHHGHDHDHSHPAYHTHTNTHTHTRTHKHTLIHTHHTHASANEQWAWNEWNVLRGIFGS